MNGPWRRGGRFVGTGPCACPHFVFDRHSGVNLDQCGINYRHSCASRNLEPMRLLVRSYFFLFEVSRITPLRVGLLLFGKTDGEVRAQACKRAGEGSAPTEEGGACVFCKSGPLCPPVIFSIPKQSLPLRSRLTPHASAVAQSARLLRHALPSRSELTLKGGVVLEPP